MAKNSVLASLPTLSAASSDATTIQVHPLRANLFMLVWNVHAFPLRRNETKVNINWHMKTKVPSTNLQTLQQNFTLLMYRKTLVYIAKAFNTALLYAATRTYVTRKNPNTVAS